MGRAGRNTRPHKTSGLEPATTPEESESEGLSQQKDASPKGFAEIHGDMPAAAPFPRSQACPDKRRVIFHKKDDDDDHHDDYDDDDYDDDDHNDDYDDDMEGPKLGPHDLQLAPLSCSFWRQRAEIA